MPFTAYGDVFMVFLHTFPLVNEGVWDIYLYYSENLPHHEGHLPTYEPLHYLVFGLWTGLGKWFLDPSYSVWANNVLTFIPYAFLNDFELLFSLPGAEVKFATLFFWKSLLLVFDLATVLLIFKICRFDSEKEAPFPGGRDRLFFYILSIAMVRLEWPASHSLLWDCMFVTGGLI